MNGKTCILCRDFAIKRPGIQIKPSSIQGRKIVGSGQVVVLQILAVVFAIIWAASSSLPVNMVPLLMTCAASAIAWSQIKRYGELAQTYSLASQELGDQEAIASDITEEADFLALVEQVEETISREHTMWCARRDVVISPTNKGS